MKPLVSICCLTYNHEAFIRQCLDGFFLQRTDFAFEILIHDDASTDKTADIIREYESRYPESIKATYQTINQYSYRNIGLNSTYQFPMAKGKYIALCEGDDYWTDPYKLQKQIDFLEENPEYILCCHRYTIFDEDTKEHSPDYGHELFEADTPGISFDNLFNLKKAWLTKTMTVVFRNNILDYNLFDQYKHMRDTHLFYHLLKLGKGYCLNFDGAVYRKHQNSLHSKLPRSEKVKMHYRVYSELRQKNPEDDPLFAILGYRIPFLEYIRSSFYEREYSKALFKDAATYVKEEFKEYGFIAGIKCILRIGLSICRSFGVKRKKQPVYSE